MGEGRGQCLELRGRTGMMPGAGSREGEQGRSQELGGRGHQCREPRGRSGVTSGATSREGGWGQFGDDGGSAGIWEPGGGRGRCRELAQAGPVGAAADEWEAGGAGSCGQGWAAGGGWRRPDVPVPVPRLRQGAPGPAAGESGADRRPHAALLRLLPQPAQGVFPARQVPPAPFPTLPSPRAHSLTLPVPVCVSLLLLLLLVAGCTAGT